MPALLQLQNEHPELQVDVIFNDRVINPVTEGVDLSLRLGDVSEGFCRTPAWHRAQSVTRLSGSAGENGSS